jgi:hypothetical protein
MEIDLPSKFTPQELEAAQLLLSLGGRSPKPQRGDPDDTEVEDDVDDEEESVFSGYAEEEEEVLLADQHAATHWTDEFASQWPQNDPALYQPFLEDMKNWTKLSKDPQRKRAIIEHLNRWPGLGDKAQKAVWQDLNNWPFVGSGARQVILQKGTYSHKCSFDNIGTDKFLNFFFAALVDLEAGPLTTTCGKDKEWCIQLKGFLVLQLENPGATRHVLADQAADGKKFTKEKLTSRERLWIQARYILPSEQGKFAKVPGLLTHEGTRSVAVQYCEDTGDSRTAIGLAATVNKYWKTIGGRPYMGKSAPKNPAAYKAQVLSERTARTWINALGYEKKNDRKKKKVNYPTPPQSPQKSANSSPAC